jgi:hypothetical protein
MSAAPQRDFYEIPGKRQRVENIEELLDEALESFLNEATISLNSLTSETLQHMERMLSTYGLVFVNDVIEDPEHIEQSIVQASNDYLGKHYPHMKSNSVNELTMHLHTPKRATGIIGAKQTGMLNMFPAKRSLNITLDAHSEPVDANPWYAMNVKLLASKQLEKFTSLLIALGTSRDGANTRKLSEDTCKIADRNNPATEPHIDYYHNAKERIQCCLHVRTSERELGYLPTTERIQDWLRTHEPALFGEFGLKKLPQGVLRQEIEARCIAPMQGTAVFWISETVHGEQFFCKPQNGSTYRRACAPVPQHGHVTRLYVGTHSDDLPLATLREMAVMLHSLDTPLTVSRFQRAAKPTRIQLNKMSTGSTGRYTQCNRTPEELQHVEKAIEQFAEIDRNAAFQALPPLLKQLAGITQPLTHLQHVAELLSKEQQIGWNLQAEQIAKNAKTSTNSTSVSAEHKWVRDGFVSSHLIHAKRMESFE